MAEFQRGGAMHIAAALAGCRNALVGTGLGNSLLFDTNAGADPGGGGMGGPCPPLRD